MALCCTRPSVRVHTPRTRLLDLSEVDAGLVITNEACAWMKDASPAAVRRLYQSGRGVYGMKALDGGRITGRMAVAAALRYAFRDPYSHAICVGLTSERLRPMLRFGVEPEAAVADW
jgi:hypothetical protein